MLTHDALSWQIKEAKTITELESIKLANEELFAEYPYLGRLFTYRFDELIAKLSPEGAE